MRATFSRIDTLTNASVLPGVGRHYLDGADFTECQAKQTASHYVALGVRKTLKIKGLFHNSTAAIIFSRACTADQFARGGAGLFAIAVGRADIEFRAMAGDFFDSTTSTVLSSAMRSINSLYGSIPA
jgi:hypothetical protein